jgi:hypothetical protein
MRNTYEKQSENSDKFRNVMMLADSGGFVEAVVFSENHVLW